MDRIQHVRQQVRDLLLFHLLDETDDLVLVLDDHRVMLLNAAADAFLTGDAPALTGIRWRSIVHPDDVSVVERAASTGDRADIRLRSGDGNLRTFRIATASSARTDAGRATVLVLRDRSEDVARIARVAHLESDLQRAHLHDPVTGLPRRSMLLAAAEERFDPADPRPSPVVAVVIKRFSEQAGMFEDGRLDDDVRAIAATIDAELGPDDLLGRGQFGEFVVLLPAGTSSDHAASVAERILTAIGEGVGVGRSRIDVAVGVADGAGGTTDVVVSFKQATIAASWAAALAVPAIERYSPERRWREEHLATVRGQVRAAMHDQVLDVHFQPIVDTVTGRTIAVEALLRWDHDRVELPPVPIVFDAIGSDPLAEELDRYVLDRCLTRLSLLGAELGTECPQVTINVSPVTVADPDFANHLDRSILAAQAEPSLICLEITEHVPFDTDDSLRAGLRAVRAIGVRVAIDDFGSGYSSLRRLNQLDVDVVKIDRSLITDLGVADRSGEIVTSVIQVGQRLGIDVIAEGVETPQQRAWLDRAGCPFIQGFLMARALPWDDAVRFVRASNAGGHAIDDHDGSLPRRAPRRWLGSHER